MTDGTRNRNPWLRFGTAVVVALFCVGIAAPVFAQGQYQFSQRNLKKIQKVFEFLQLGARASSVRWARSPCRTVRTKRLSTIWSAAWPRRRCSPRNS